MYLIAADIGNSRVKLGVFAIRVGSGSLGIECFQSLSTPHDQPPDWKVLLSSCHGERPFGIIAASRPGRVGMLLDDWPTSAHEPEVVRSAVDVPVVLDVMSPEKVGIDRALNAVAANHLRPANRPAVIIDSGTATTIDLVNARGVFCGGTILPGLALSARALHRYTELLPLVRGTELGPSPPEILGRDTRSAIQSGLFWGHVGAIAEIAQRLGELLEQPPVEYLTGGAAHLLAAQRPAAELREHLALRGLAWTAAQRLLGLGESGSSQSV